MGKKFKIAMFLTSFFPLWITIIFQNIMILISTNKNVYTEILWIILLPLIFTHSSLVIIFSIRKKSRMSGDRFILEKASLDKGITSDFLLAYILPLFAFDFSSWQSSIQFIFYFLILMFLSVRNNNVYINILLELLGYKFYTCDINKNSIVEEECLIISKSNLSSMKGNPIKIVSLNKPIYINVEE